MNITASDIIPDRILTEDDEVGFNLYGARCLLDKFLYKFSRTGDVNPNCLYEILDMDLEQARTFLQGHAGAGKDCIALDTAAYSELSQILAALQMMIHSYLNDPMICVA